MTELRDGADRVELSSLGGKLAVTASILGSGLGFLDMTVVNVALPELQDEFGIPLSDLQWIINSYLLTLAALLLFGSSLADLYGRRRIFEIGVALFGVSSLVVGLASSFEIVVAGRLAQGVGAALLTPASLAMLEAGFVRHDRPVAIGIWSSFSGITTIVGPAVGGWLIDVVSWRWAFLINPPVAALAIVLSRASVPETKDVAARRPDLVGAVMATTALGSASFALIEGPGGDWTTPLVLAAGGISVAALGAFFWWEATTADPMLPLGLFRRRQFSGANATTAFVYFALGGLLFLLTLQLRENLGYSAFLAGIAFTPAMALLFVLSPPAGRVMSRIGPRRLMTVGPMIIGIGLGLLWLVDLDASYVPEIVVALTVIGIGLGATVAPLTSTALSSVPERHTGLASGVNNTVARLAGLLAVPLLPFFAGISAATEEFGLAFSDGFRRSMVIAGVLCVIGGLVAWRTIDDEEYLEAARDEAESPAGSSP